MQEDTELKNFPLYCPKCKVSIFFSILTSKYYPTKFIKFIATVFKFLLLDYLTAEKECFHIGLLFTCHFFVFLILYPPVQQIA